MLRTSSTIVVIFSLLLLSVGNTATAQTKQSIPEISSESSDIQSKPELKTLIAQADKKAAEQAFDPVAADKTHERSRAQQKKGWSTGDKLLLAGLIVGIAAIVFIVVKYGKECLRSSPANCTPGVDEFCVCEEYERRNP